MGTAAARRGARRTRRSPEAARELLLSAAESLIAERGPDGVTLREVGEAAGVTAGLVTHYFGTYAGLVRAVRRRQGALARERMHGAIRAGGGVPDADVLLRTLFESLADPRGVRLFVWSALRGELARSSTRGLRDVVDALEAAFRRTLPAAEVPPRVRIEQVALLALSAIHGWAVGKQAWLSGLGLGPATRERDEAFLAALTHALRAHMAGGARSCP